MLVQFPSSRAKSRDPAEELATGSGIGDEAFWTGNRVGGVLYVLKKDVFIRVSLGGSDTPETRINKSKALAEKALGRL